MQLSLFITLDSSLLYTQNLRPIQMIRSTFFHHMHSCSSSLTSSLCPLRILYSEESVAKSSEERERPCDEYSPPSLPPISALPIPRPGTLRRVLSSFVAKDRKRKSAHDYWKLVLSQTSVRVTALSIKSKYSIPTA